MSAPKIKMMQTKLSVGELSYLSNWAAMKHERWPSFTKWLAEVSVGELERRTKAGSEPGMAELPKWNGDDLADALEASFVLSRHPQTDGLADFIEEIAQHVLANSSAALRTFDKAILI